MFVSAWAFLVGLVLFVAIAGAALLRVRSVTKDARLFRAVAEGASDGLIVMHRDSQIIWANEAYSRIMGYDHGELLGRYPLKFALPPHLALSDKEIETFRFDERDERFGCLTQVENVRKDGREFIHEFSHAALHVGGEPLFLLAGRDITKRVEREQALLAAQDRLKRQSRTDGLTGLFNRAYMQAHLNTLIAAKSPFAVLLIDVNGMKQVNDTFGHLAGDALLLQVSKALQTLADEAWFCARTGGDEFVVILEKVTTLSTAAEIGQRIVDEAATPFTWEAATLTTEISVGAAIWEQTISSSDALLNRADIALYEAKTSAHQSVACYDTALQQKHEEAQNFEREVVTAAREQRFSFDFQPIVNVEANRTVRFEMLVRWHHPELGTIPPDQFLPVINQLRLAPRLDRLLITAAEHALKRLDAAGLEHVGLSINISPDALSTPDIADRLRWLAEYNTVDPDRIAIEVLESTALITGGNDLPIRLISQLREAGFDVFLDDFGMGYAGLAHLASVPTDGLKVDRALTAAVDTDAASHAIVCALIRLARELGMRVVAEGVETLAQLEILQDAGCYMFQGYFVAPPMPLDGAIAWVHDSPKSSTSDGG